MASIYASYPITGGGGGGVNIYSTFGAFPPGTAAGQLAVAADTGILYEWNGSAWVPIAGPSSALSLGNLDAQAGTAKGAALTGGVLSMQSASATEPGLVNTTTQSLAGNKTFTGTITAANLTGQNSGDAQVIWQPGGVQAGNVYTTWAAVYAAILPLGVAAIDVCCDSTFSSTFTITAGTYALGNTTIQAPVGQAPTSPITVTIANGVTFTSFPVVSQLINIVSVSSSTVFTIPTNGYFIDVLRGASLTSVSGAPMITVPTGMLLYLGLEPLSTISGASGFPVISLVGTGSVFAFVAEGSTFGSASVGGGASSSIGYVVDSASATINTTQPDFSGTSSFDYRPLITNVVLGSGLGDTAYQGAAGAGLTLPANTSATKMFLSETGTGSAGNAPVWSAISSGDLPNIPVTSTSTNASFFPTFVNSSTTGSYPLDVAAGLSFNPSTNKLSTTAINLSGLSASQAVVTDGSKNLSSLVYTSTVTNSSIVSRDTNGNSGFNNSSVAVTSTVSSGQTIGLTAGSTGRQRITGTSTVTFNLPDSTTLLSGWPFYFFNSSTNNLTVNYHDGVTLLVTIPPQGIIFATCLDNSSSNGVWGATAWLTPGATSGSAGTSLPGSLTLGSPLTVPNGGTGLATLTAHNVQIGNGTGTVTQVAPTATTGIALVSNGASSDPSFAALNLAAAGAVTGALPIANGGTGQTTANPAFNALSPLTTKGDMLTYTTVNARLAVPGDYGDFVADSTTSTGWRAASYVQTNGRPDKNYIQYADFENNSTTGWTLGTIGTLTNGLPTGSPTFGSGASGNLSLAIASSSQLSGAFSLSYVSSAATTAGNMVASSSYAIDPSSQAKVLQISFAYNIFSGAANANFSGSSSNSYAWAIWDVTNSSWLTSAGNFNLVQNSGVGICTGTCQTNATTANIRLVVYNANATSGAATMYFDDFFVGPQIVQKGPAMSDWVSGPNFVPASGAFGTISGSTWYTQRVGDSLAVRGYWVLGTTAGGTASIALPSGYSIDTTKLGATANSTGVGKLWSNTNSATPNPYGTGNVAGAVFYDGSTSGSVFLALSGKSSGFNKNVGTDFGGSFQMAVEFTIPISGWSSNSVQSSDTDTRVVAAQYYLSANQTPSANAQINYDTKVIDTHAAVTTGVGAWKFTAPVSGIYQLQSMTNAGSTTDLQMYKNGSGNAILGVAGTAAGTTSQATGQALIQLNAGDFIDVRTSSSVVISGAANNTASYVNIFRLSGPAVITATDTVNARYYASSTSLSGSLATINWTTKDFDSANGMSSGTYSVPVSGKYQVNSAILVSGTVALNSTLIMEIQKNGTVVSRYTEYAGGVETNLKGIITDIISCLAGDTLRIQVSTSVSGPAIVSSNFDNYMSLSRVGN